MSILDKIYDWYVMYNPKCPGDHGVWDQFCEQWEKVDQILSKELAEGLQTSMFAYMEEESRIDFQAGFRLGALLMQELHTQSGAPNLHLGGRQAAGPVVGPQAQWRPLEEPNPTS